MCNYCGSDWLSALAVYIVGNQVIILKQTVGYAALSIWTPGIMHIRHAGPLKHPNRVVSYKIGVQDPFP